ncbi:hypothetical protein [Enterobacter mori]
MKKLNGVIKRPEGGYGAKYGDFTCEDVPTTQLAARAADLLLLANNGKQSQLNFPAWIYTKADVKKMSEEMFRVQRTKTGRRPKEEVYDQEAIARDLKFHEPLRLMMLNIHAENMKKLKSQVMEEAVQVRRIPQTDSSHFYLNSMNQRVSPSSYPLSLC